MLELLLCSMFTILPDYLFRRYMQGKKSGVRSIFIQYGLSSVGELQGV